jgi:hypothetical protein
MLKIIAEFKKVKHQIGFKEIMRDLWHLARVLRQVYKNELDFSFWLTFSFHQK